MKPSKRLERIPPYAFAELERKIARKREEGVDVISLGIGDPDRPTPPLIVEAMQEAVSEPETHKYPSNRGREDFRGAVRDFYERRFDVKLDPDSEIVPALGAKEAIFNLNLAFLDPGRLRAGGRPGLSGVHGRAVAGGRGAGADGAASRSWDSCRTWARSRRRSHKRAKLMFLNYPNNPTGAVVPEGFFERVVEFARAYEILVVHDNAYSEISYDGYRAPSFLADAGREGRGDRGVLAVEGLQHDRLALRGRGRKRAGDRDLLAAEDEHRLGHVRGGAAGGRGGALARRRRGGARR